MSINIGNEGSKLTIYKDEKGRYKTYIKGEELKEDGSKEEIFMSKKVTFRRDVEVKNKSVIEVIKGWSSCYRIRTDETYENGKVKYKYYDKYFISEFNLLEEGVDEPQRSRQQTQTKAQIDYSFDMSNDELPF